MAPAVYVRKKSGELRMCVDYSTSRQQRMDIHYHCQMKSKISWHDPKYSPPWISKAGTGNCQCTLKTDFCLGPGLELYQFCQMPFGLSGAPSSFQRLVDKVLHGRSFATTYVDDILVHSASEEEHNDHLGQVFQRLREAGLTLKGKKCHIGKTQVSYLGHVFSGTGMVSDPQKVQAVKDWPTPTSVTDVRQF